jgi:hypothetical protein
MQAFKVVKLVLKHSACLCHSTEFAEFHLRLQAIFQCFETVCRPMLLLLKEGCKSADFGGVFSNCDNSPALVTIFMVLGTDSIKHRAQQIFCEFVA